MLSVCEAQRLPFLNGSVAQPPPAKRLRVIMIEKETTLGLRRKYIAYVGIYNFLKSNVTWKGSNHRDYVQYWHACMMLL